MAKCANWLPSTKETVDANSVILLLFAVLAIESFAFGIVEVVTSRASSTTARPSTLTLVFGFTILAVILTVILVALIRRMRWAWMVSLILYGGALVADVFNFRGIAEITLDIVRVGLLISPQMRRYVGIRGIAKTPRKDVIR
jgi:hypothetical protein